MSDQNVDAKKIIALLKGSIFEYIIFVIACHVQLIAAAKRVVEGHKK